MEKGGKGTPTQEVQPTSPSSTPPTSIDAPSVTVTISSPTSTSPSGSSVVVEEKTTTIRVPMLRPRPKLLEVLRLAGGHGETYTMKEIISHVQEYIQQRKLYDVHKPHMVYCSNDLLGEALGVSQFSVVQALYLFARNCTLEQDSCLRIHTELVTRAEPETVSPYVRSVFSTALNSSATNTVSSSSQSETVGNGMNQHQSMEIDTAKSSPVLMGACRSSVILSQSDLNSEPNENVNQFVSSMDPGHNETIQSSCSQSSGSSLPSSREPRRRSTSVSVKCDEVDGDGGWACEVTMETSSSEHETVVVECQSDAFSVEYEVESSSDCEQQTSQEASRSRLSRERGSSESDVSSSTPGTAAIVVVCESDVEYQADYSDSNNGSDAELMEDDKWQCKYCSTKNLPFQRNCAGCWSVRPDWLPYQMNDVQPEEKTEESVGASASSEEPTSQESGLGLNQSSEKLQEKELNCAPSIIVTAPSINSHTSSRKRKYSSCLETSDSQEDKLTQEEVKKEDDKADSVDNSSEKSPKKSIGKMTNSKPCSDPCVVCLTRPKTASIIHGKTGHQVCCYRCARRLKIDRKACPICRKPIQKVVRNFYL